jgi:oligo-1,6-glucosidase
VVALGDFTMLLPEHEHVYAFTRTLGDQTLLVVCNVGATPYRLADLLPQALDAELVLGNLPNPGDTLRPWEAQVLQVA